MVVPVEPVHSSAVAVRSKNLPGVPDSGEVYFFFFSRIIRVTPPRTIRKEKRKVTVSFSFRKNMEKMVASVALI